MTDVNETGRQFTPSVKTVNIAGGKLITCAAIQIAYTLCWTFDKEK